MIDYQRAGGFDDLIISHSDSLSLEIHPTLFRARKQGGKREDSPSLERGDLLHQWIERKDKFIISDLDKPSGKIGDMLDTVYELLFLDHAANNSAFSHFCTKDFGITMEDLTTYKNFYLGLYGKAPSEEEIKLLIAAFRFARQEHEVGGIVGKKGAHSETTILSKLQEGRSTDYLNFKRNAKGKMILTRQDRDILTNCYESLRRHPSANRLLFELEGESELELFWTEIFGGIEIKRKAKIDKVIVDHTTKKLIIVDPKTTAFPVTKFAENDSINSYTKYKYPRQVNSYSAAYMKNHPEINWVGYTVSHYLIPVQTTDQFPTMVYRIPQSQKLLTDFTNSMERAAYHIKSGNWDITMEEQINGYVTVEA